MKILIQNTGLLILLLSLSACGQSSQSQKTQDHEPVINAKATLDKAQSDIDDAVGTKLEQMAKVDLLDIYENAEAYLAMNTKKPGVKVTSSGLQYRILKQGSGAKPTAESFVKVNYRGTFPDGREFDSSYKRGEPSEFKVGGVIKGWSEALLLMQEGTKLELVVPPDLAYGEEGAGTVIPPDQVLKFQIELLDADVQR
ncbi:MAG: FKBP-type peptidyl-prolyl cis-trans isomerase [Gammaproteobacteria bacterium]|nr:FKBP-type peptidyl-prolyl cis-trans isomerase [Gammaproteobacteria bacterium]NNC98387.1 FKBP-type peptidyl-prolyl cis-trans isomerase [Gammaproteobacteria bacterium]NNM13055.1 FKBP-type peptidyl-prolyl cis-trans isomerase [Gammaproteobacteria bacterium]